MDLLELLGPENHNRGPATNECSEHGDTWKGAIDKINANFKAMVARFAQTAENVEHAIADEVKGLHDRVTAVEQKPAEDVDALHARIAELEARLAAYLATAPAPPPPTSTGAPAQQQD